MENIKTGLTGVKDPTEEIDRSNSGDSSNVALAVVDNEIFHGNFVTVISGVQGELYSRGDTLVIKDFKYNGQTEAVFLAGTKLPDQLPYS